MTKKTPKYVTVEELNEALRSCSAAIFMKLQSFEMEMRDEIKQRLQLTHEGEVRRYDFIEVYKALSDKMDDLYAYLEELGSDIHDEMHDLHGHIKQLQEARKR